MATATLNQRGLSRSSAHGVMKTLARPMQTRQNVKNNFNEQDKITSFVSENEMIDFINDIGEQYYGN